MGDSDDGVTQELPSDTSEIDANNEVRHIECDRWDDFTREVRVPRVLKLGGGRMEFPGRVLWRGHADPQWKLRSRIERSLVAYGKNTDGSLVRFPHLIARYDSRCKDTLERFRELAHGKPGSYPKMPDDELWALGRHVGLITPLLDWTESPYVAAYFALVEHRKRWERERGDGVIDRRMPLGAVCVWALRVWSDMERTDEFEVVRNALAHVRSHAECCRWRGLQGLARHDLRLRFVSPKKRRPFHALPVPALATADKDL